MYNFEIKNQLTHEELLEYFELLKNHLIEMYGEENVSSGFSSWYENRAQKSLQKFFIKMSNGNEVLGYAEIMIRKDGSLYFCDIIIHEKMRRTRLLFEFLTFVLKAKEFENFDEIYMHINRNNEMSLRTWSHFDYEKIDEQKLSNFYKIKREKIEKYLKNVTKNAKR